MPRRLLLALLLLVAAPQALLGWVSTTAMRRKSEAARTPLGLGGYVLSSVQRQIQTARSRVSFAGQVSHELRTPLTNIQLYAELAESDLKSLPRHGQCFQPTGRKDERTVPDARTRGDPETDAGATSP